MSAQISSGDEILLSHPDLECFSNMKPTEKNSRLIWLRTFFFIGLFIGTLIFVYSPALRGGFVWDDDAYVTQNPMLTAPDGWQRIWFSAHQQSQFFPLVYSTLRIEHALWGWNPLGYHLVNVLLHAVNALLVWLILRKMALPGAWIAAGLFAFHPVQVESVAWITELKNVQSTFFYLLSLLLWLRFVVAEKSTWAPYFISLIFYVLALLSKTTTCTLPAALVLICWMRGQKLSARRIWQITPFVVLGFSAGLISIWWESHLGNYRENVGQQLSVLQRGLLASHAICFYLSKLVWPANLAFSYPKWALDVSNLWNYACLLICVIGVGAGFIYRKTLGRSVIAAFVFFIATLSPLLGFIPLYTFLYSYVADHYQYVACIGIFCLAGAALSRLQPTASICLITLLAILTWKQAHVFQNLKTLWEDTLSKNSLSWLSHNNLGMILKEEGNIDGAIAHYEQALQLNHDYANPNYNLGIIYYQRRDLDKALLHFQEAVRLRPEDAESHNNFGATLRAKGRLDEAIAQFREAVRLDPTYVLAEENLQRTLALKSGLP